MMLMLMVSLWILGLLSEVTTSEPACGITGVCDCRLFNGDGNKISVNCSDRKLTRFPKDIPEATYNLDLSYNLFDYEISEDLPNLPDLVSLSLAYTNKSALSSTMFSKSEWLEDLDLSGNILVHVNSDSFASLTSVRTIIGLESKQFAPETFRALNYLQGLDIVFHQEDIPPNIFDGLKLHSLRLEAKTATELPKDLLRFAKTSMSNITIIAPFVETLDQEMFMGLTQLKRVKLFAQTMQHLPSDLFHKDDVELQKSMPRHLVEIVINGVKSLPRNIFQNQLSLEHLALHNIEDMPSGIVSHLGTLNFLDLSDSNIGELPPHWFASVSSLKTLILRNTKLSKLVKESFQGLNSLSSLDLSHNRLEQIERYVFSNFGNTLEHLNISHNNITSLKNYTFSGMFSLKTLDLSRNSILPISDKAFSDLEKILHINLRANHIAYIPENVLYYQRDLIDLDLATNNLTTLPAGLLLNTRSLKRFDISNNPIATFPDNFFKNVRFLERLEMTDNPIHCDCKIMLLNRGSRVTIDGDCLSPEEFRGIPAEDIPFNDTCLIIHISTTLLTTEVQYDVTSEYVTSDQFFTTEVHWSIPPGRGVIPGRNIELFSNIDAFYVTIGFLGIGVVISAIFVFIRRGYIFSRSRTYEVNEAARAERNIDSDEESTEHGAFNSPLDMNSRSALAPSSSDGTEV